MHSCNYENKIIPVFNERLSTSRHRSGAPISLGKPDEYLPRIINLIKRKDYEIYDNQITFFSGIHAKHNLIGIKHINHYNFRDADMDDNRNWHSCYKYMSIALYKYKMDIKTIIKKPDVTIIVTKH